ncbi:7077_t:CDS:2 [Acaulospora morrowiae]|uniref:7077_t:CDS:1 n=1 Tax=Acaulospora morrowiae TaxID=94023 RepID=A0A9N9A0K7_9GLOM|nr:7077_t:CDS:2 [Acaulospora morrowiae]
MFVRPSLISGLRSSWKSIKESSYFILQQQNSNNSKRRQFPEFRIITKGFPHYKVAEHDDLNQILELFDDVLPDILSEVEGKKTSKKILKQLRDRCSKEFDEDGDGYVTDSSVTPEDGNSSGEIDDQDHDNYSLEVNMVRSSNSSSSSTKSENAMVDEKEKNKETDRDLAIQSPDQLDFTANQSDYPDSNSDTSDAEVAVDANNDPEGVDGGAQVDEWWSLGNNLMYSMMSWLEGPSVGVKVVPEKQTTSTNQSSNNKNVTILDIPFQFIALLTYPEIDPKATKKASFAVLREISNCAMLFLMKNSGRVNVTMAKRAVRQRIGWAKQWAGSLFRHRANSAHSTNNTSNLSSNNSRKNNSNASNAHMVKPGSLDDMHSGSLSDTTHGGSVTRKMAPKRGGFFRYKNGQASTSSQAAKESNSERFTGTITSEPSAILDSTQQESSKSSSISPPLPPLTPTSLGGVTMQMSLSNPPQSVSTTGNTPYSITEIPQAPTLTKRRFFPKRMQSNSSNSNHVNNVATSQQNPSNPSSYSFNGSLINHGLSDIVEHKPSPPIHLSNAIPTGIGNSAQQNDTVNGIFNNNEIISTANSNKIVNGTTNKNNGSVNAVHSIQSSPTAISSNNNSNDSNDNTINAKITNRSSFGISDTEFAHFDDSSESFTLNDEVRIKKFPHTKNSRAIIGHHKNNSGGIVSVGSANVRAIEPPD